MKKFLPYITAICLITIINVLINKVRAEEVAISVGSISSEPKEEIADFQPFIDYVASHLQKHGITRGKVVVADSMEEMSNLIKKGEVDLFIDSPFPSIFVGRLSGAKPLLRRWKKNTEHYHSVIFVRKDSGIESVEDLKGKVIIFEKPFSTSDYLLPKATLMKQGLKLTEKETVEDPVSADEIGYVFSYDEETTMMWVLRKRASSGALNNEEMKEFAKDRINELEVILETIDVPRHMLSYRSDLDPDLVMAIENVLVNMDKDEKGIGILKDFSTTTKFDRFPGGVEEDLRPMEELVDFVEQELSGK